MLLTIKVLNGDECKIQANSDVTVLELKQEVQKILQVSVAHQKILHIGRALLDEKTLGSYQTIKDGTKLTLVIKKPETLKEAILRCFRKYYDDKQSEKLTVAFMFDFEQRLKQFSIDDIERIATNALMQQCDE